MQTLIWRFVTDEGGAVSIEYGVIAGSIAIAIAAVVAQIGGELTTPFEAVRPALASKAG